MFRLLKLEERIVLSGDFGDEILDGINQMEGHEEEFSHIADGDDGDSLVDQDVPLAEGDLDDPSVGEGLHVLVVSSDADPEGTLSGAAREGVMVLRYDAETTSLDGLSAMIQDALGGQKADSIAFATHNEGTLVQLTSEGATTIGELMRSGGDHQDFWGGIGESVADGGRIDLLACNVLENGAGEQFLSRMEDVTGVNVAASTDLTGNEAYGGDWVLESDGIDVSGTYFDAEALENFDGVLYQGQDPDPGYLDLHDRTVTANKYSFISIPNSAYSDEAPGNDAITVSATGSESWVFYSASQQGIWLLKPPNGASADINVSISDESGNTLSGADTDFLNFTVTATTAAKPTYDGAPATLGLLSEDAVAGTVVGSVADPDLTGGTYEIVSGNPTTNGTDFGFEIDPSTGEISVADPDLIKFSDPYISNNTYALKVLYTDASGNTSLNAGGQNLPVTVYVPIEQGAVEFDVALSVTTLSLEEDPAGNNTAQVQVTITPNPTSAVTINLDFTQAATDGAEGPSGTGDYNVDTTSLNFTAGQSVNTATITVADDGIGAPDAAQEFFSVAIDAGSLPANYNAVGPTANLTIIDGAQPAVGISLAPTSFAEGEGSVLTVSLTGGTFSTDTPVTLDFGGEATHGTAIGANVDFVAPQVVTIPEGLTAVTVGFEALVDNVTEGTGFETFSVAIVDDPANPFKIDSASGTQEGTITDTVVELPRVRITANDFIVSEGETFQVTAQLFDRDGNPTAAGEGGVLVALDTEGGSATRGEDFIAPASIFVPAGAQSASETVLAVLDGVSEPNEDISINIGPGTDYLSSPTFNPFFVTIEDVSTPTVTVQGGGTIFEDGGAGATSTIVTVNQSPASGNGTTVVLGVAGTPLAERGADFTAQYTFNSTNVSEDVNGNWLIDIPANQNSASIRISAIADNIYDGSVNDQIVLTVNSAGTSLIGTADTATVEIVDADTDQEPVVNLWIDRDVSPANGAPDTVGTFPEGGVLRGAVQLPTGDLVPAGVDSVVYLKPDAGFDAVAGDDYELYSNSGATTTIPMVSVGGEMVWPVTISGGTGKANFWVGGLNDDFYEGSEDFGLSIQSVLNGTTVGAANTAIQPTIDDVTATPDVTVTISPLAVHELASETPNSATVTVTLTAQAGTTLGTADVGVTLDGIPVGVSQAVELEDYTLFLADGTTPVTFAGATGTGEWTSFISMNGGTQASATFVLKGIPDEIEEGDETFQLSAALESNTGTSATATILDDAGANPVTVSIADVNPDMIGEGAASTITLQLTRDYADDLGVTLDFGGTADATGPNQDYQIVLEDGTTEDVASDGTYVFTIPADAGTQATFSVQAFVDGQVEPDENFTLQIAGISPDGANEGFETGIASVTINESLEVPEVSLFWNDGGNLVTDATLSEGDSIFLVARLDNPTTQAVTVDLLYTNITTDDTDYSGSAQITILANAIQGQALVDIAADGEFEDANETFQVEISGVAGNAVNNTPDTVTGVILPSDLDVPIQVSLAWENGDDELTEGNTDTAAILVQLDRAIPSGGDDIVVDLSFTSLGADATDDYDVATTPGIDAADTFSVTLSEGETQALVSLEAKTDSIVEGDEIFQVDMDITAGTAGAAEAGGAQVLTGTIIDATNNPEIELVVLKAAGTEDLGFGDAMEFQAQIANGITVNEDIVVKFSNTESATATTPADYSPNPGSQLVTIAAGATQSGIYRIIPQPDDIYEGDQFLTVGLEAATLGGDTALNISGATDATATILEDDPLPQVSLTAVAQTSIISEATLGSTAAFSLSLDRAAFEDVTVTLLIGDDLGDGNGGGDYTLSINGDIITVGDLDGSFQYDVLFTQGVETKPIVVEVIDDGDREGNETVTFRIAGIDGGGATAGAEDSQVFTIIDDDAEVFVDLGYQSSNGFIPSPIFGEDNGSAGSGVVTINLVDAAGTPTTALPGTFVTLDFGAGTATAEDGISTAGADFGVFLNAGGSNAATTVGPQQFEIPIAEGNQGVDVYLFGNEDGLFELDELVNVSAVSAEKINIDAAEGTTAIGTITLIDTDGPPTVSISPLDPVSFTEGTTASFTLTFNGASEVDTPVTLDFGGAATAPDDYELRFNGSPVTITNGSAIITVPGSDLLDGAGTVSLDLFAVADGVFDPEQDVSISIAESTGGPKVLYEVGTTGTVTGTIIDVDEAPIVRLGAASSFGMDENVAASAVTIPVELVDEFGNAVSIGADTVVTLGFEGRAVPAADGASPTTGDDYIVLYDADGNGPGDFTEATVSGGQARITIAEGSSLAFLRLTPEDDGVFEGDESAVVTLAEAGPAIPSTVGSDLTQSVTIIEDDAEPQASIEWSAADFPENGSIQLIANLDAAADVDAVITVDIGATDPPSGFAQYTPGAAQTDGDDVTADTGNNVTQIVVPSGQTQASITLFGLADEAFEGDESLPAQITADVVFKAEFADVTSNNFVTAPVTAVILDDPADAPDVTLGVDSTSVTEGNSSVITLYRSGDASVDTVVELTLNTAGGTFGADAGDFTLAGVSGGDVSFAADGQVVTAVILAGESTAQVTIAADADALYEADENFTVTITDVFGGTIGATASETVTILDDGGAAPTVSLENQASGGTAGDVTFFEAGTPTTATFTVQLRDGGGGATDSFQDESITIQLGGDATPTIAPRDYSVQVDIDGTNDATNGFVNVAVNDDGTFTFTMPVGATQAEVRFTGLEDTPFESPEEITATLTDVGGMNIDTANDAFTYTLVDDDPAPQVVLAFPNGPEMQEGNARTMRVQLRDPADISAPEVAATDVIVGLRFGTTPDGGEDYQLVPGALDSGGAITEGFDAFVTIAAGATQSAGIFISSIEDEFYEGNEDFTVGITEVQNAVTAAGQEQATVTILDDESLNVRLTVNQTSMIEGGEVELTFTLVDPATGNVVSSPQEEVVWVDFSTTDDDSVGDTTSDVWGTEARYDIDGDLWPADYVANDASGKTGGVPNGIDLGTPTNPNTGERAFAVTIPAETTEFTVFLHSTDDNQAPADPPGFGGGDRFLFEKDEQFTVSITDDSFLNNLKADPDSNTATVTIEDDDQAAAPEVELLGFVTDGETTEGDSDSVQVRLDGPTNQFVQVTVQFNADPGDIRIDGASAALNGFTASPDGTTAWLQFAPDTAAQTVQINYTALDDVIFEGDEQFTVTLGAVTFANDETADVLTGTIFDDDIPTISIGVDENLDFAIDGASGTVAESDEEQTGNYFIIDKGGVETTQPILVDYVVTSIDADITGPEADVVMVDSGTLTLPNESFANGSLAATIIGDDLDEGDERFTVTISNPRTQSGLSLNLGNNLAQLTIADDDFSPQVDGADLTATVDEGGFTSITEGDLFYQDLDFPDAAAPNGGLLVYTVTSIPDDGTLYIGTPGDVTNSDALVAGASFPQLNITDGDLWYDHNGADDPTETFQYEVSDGVNTTPGTFTITVNNVLDDAPQAENIIFWANENETGEVSSLPNLSGDGLLATDADSTVSAEIAAGDPDGLFALEVTNATSPADSGEVRLRVAAGLDYEEAGSHTLLINVTDGNSPQSFLVVVNVNDLNDSDPLLTGAIPDQTLASDAGWTLQIPADVFKDGELVTYQYRASNAQGPVDISDWFHFETETETFWYSPFVGNPPTEDATFQIEVTAEYWYQNNELKGAAQDIFTLNYDYIASLAEDRALFDALDYLDSEDVELPFLPEGDGDAVELQEMMVARGGVPAIPAGADDLSEYADVLALLDGAEEGGLPDAGVPAEATPEEGRGGKGSPSVA